MKRHRCSCGESYRWPLDLWEHLTRTGHRKAVKVPA